MFVYKTEQKEFEHCGVSFGGPPGKNPTILVGGLFFKGQEIVKDTKTGQFDKTLARDWLDTALTASERTGHPLILQIYGRMPEAMESHISWIADNFDGPFMFESINSRARISALRICEELGLNERAIYNAVNISLGEEEIQAIEESPLTTTVALGWSPSATSLEQRMATIREAIEIATSAGFEKILVDPATMPVGAGFGLDLRSIMAIKSELGMPTCLGVHNAPSAWRFLNEKGFDDENAHLSSIVAAAVSAQIVGTDCIMFGSLKRSREVFTATSLIANATYTSLGESYRALGITQDLFEPPTID